MEKLIALALTGLCFGTLEAQETYIQPGVLAFGSTITPSKMLNRDENNYYVSGFAEYFLDSKISFRSDNYIFVDGSSDVPFLKSAFRSYFGVAYHFSKGNWDNTLGFQPGITLMQLPETSYGQESAVDFSPSIALRFGTGYYVWKYFHFFANATYVRSKVSGVAFGPHQTDEFMFSAGLGFQIPTKRKR
jgi:hypothetical protein